MKMIILVGPPGSGKSTMAKQIMASSGSKDPWCRLNQDSQGKMYKKIFQQALEDQRPIIVDRMNFDVSQRTPFIDGAKAYGYEVEVHVLHENRETCLTRCMLRQGHETIHTAADAQTAIDFFFRRYEKPTTRESIDSIILHYPQGEKPSAVIFDIDGTIANNDHRQHFVQGQKPNWPMFNFLIHLDKPNNWAIDMALKFGESHEIVFCSGRHEELRDKTRLWLDKHFLSNFKSLYMRFSNDSRKDSIIKEILLDFEILTRFTPYFIVDDRQQVVDMWRSRGYTVLQCAKGDF